MSSTNKRVMNSRRGTPAPRQRLLDLAVGPKAIMDHGLNREADITTRRPDAGTGAGHDDLAAGRVLIQVPTGHVPYQGEFAEDVDDVDFDLAEQFQAEDDRLLELYLEALHCQSRASNLLDLWSALLPQRIVNEEIGDALEDINRRVAQGQRWGVLAKVISTMFWSGISAIGIVASNLLGRKKAN